MTVSRQRTNRPFKFGERDRRELIVQESEVKLKAQNDANGNPIYIGRSLIGTATDEEKWQIQFITWDANGSVTDVAWPQNDEGNPSGDYEFAWDSRATYTYV